MQGRERGEGERRKREIGEEAAEEKEGGKNRGGKIG